jgi:hypothetical protein
MTQAEREAYMWRSNADVYIGYEPPAAAGATSLTNDANMRSPYVSQILMRRTLTGVEDRIFVQEPGLLYARMTELRDHWQWIGEVDWAGWQIWHLKAFIYVKKESPHLETLSAALKKTVARTPQQIDLEDID